MRSTCRLRRSAACAFAMLLAACGSSRPSAAGACSRASCLSPRASPAMTTALPPHASRCANCHAMAAASATLATSAPALGGTLSCATAGQPAAAPRRPAIALRRILAVPPAAHGRRSGACRHVLGDAALRGRRCRLPRAVGSSEPAADMRHPVSRRALLRASLGMALPGALLTSARSHSPLGRIDPPQAAPALRVTSANGRLTELDQLLRSKVSAVQLMFTGCSATCPIQGAVFAEVQRQLQGSPAHLQLLSVSIDALGDDPKALRAWLRRFDAQAARWSAAVIAPADLDRLLDFVARPRQRRRSPHAAGVPVRSTSAVRLSHRRHAAAQVGGRLDARYRSIRLNGPSCGGRRQAALRALMQTTLAPEFRDTPEGIEAESILRACVHCGFCTATCPTYQLLGDELDGPRGRIYLIKQVLEGAPVTRKTQLHLDRCLTCRNCETHLSVGRALRSAGGDRPQHGRAEGRARAAASAPSACC